MEWLDETLARHGTLAAWADAAGAVVLARGRGAVHAVPAPLTGPDGRDRWVVRRYRRGGWAAPLGDRYVARGATRPLRELGASVAARARGVRTPAVVAGAAYRAGAVYRADLVTEEIADVRSLADLLRDSADDDVDEGLLRRTGRAVGALEGARIVHADASAGNFLLGGEGPAWVVDLDRCTILPQGARRPAERMRRRLERSLRKICAERGRLVSAAGWSALRAGYEEEP
jgi:3-deoxy-D-manno-octulosonic acid kinase